MAVSFSLESFPITMFVVSTTCLLLKASIHSLAERKRIQILKKNYAITLSQLFQVFKTAPRHSIAQVFEERRAFFQSIHNSAFGEARPLIVHVAGTKGKGSCVEYIAAGLRDFYQSKGKTVGVFTSPHLHTARER
jgi:folylpolyglutamate synthase/dihydropteroate synthase